MVTDPYLHEFGGTAALIGPLNRGHCAGRESVSRNLIEVLAVPGDVQRATSRGCNMLIRDGAYPVLDVDDFITSLTFVLGLPPKTADLGLAGSASADHSAVGD